MKPITSDQTLGGYAIAQNLRYLPPPATKEAALPLPN
jgi:hypothetical protein